MPYEIKKVRSPKNSYKVCKKIGDSHLRLQPPRGSTRPLEDSHLRLQPPRGSTRPLEDKRCFSKKGLPYKRALAQMRAIIISELGYKKSSKKGSAKKTSKKPAKKTSKKPSKKMSKVKPKKPVKN